MKKILFVFFVSALFFLNSFSITTAQSVNSGGGSTPSSSGVSYPNIMMPRPPQTSLPFGQEHYYSVALRGNGEAFVTLKTIFSNTQEASLSALKVTFPSNPKNIYIYQVNRDPQCIFYKPLPYQTQSAKPMLGNASDMYYPSPTLPITPPSSQECAQFQEPDYQYGWGDTTYQKATYQLKGNVATIELPKEIKPNGNGSYILMYTTSGFTHKNIFGAYTFTFETIKVPDRIQNLQIGFTTDPNYYLKDTKDTINYQSPTIEAIPQDIASSGKVISSAQFDTYYQLIGRGTIIKNADNLQPDESFSVKGTYADSKVKLYGKEISLTVGSVALVFLIALLAIIFGIKRILNKAKTMDKFALFATVGLSFGSSIFIMMYSGFLYAISYYFGQVFQNYSYNFIYPIIVILLLVISLCIYSLFLFVPGIFVGLKKGLFAGIATIILTIFWLLFFSFIIVGIFVLFFQSKPFSQPPYPTPYPMMEKSSTVQTK